MEHTPEENKIINDIKGLNRMELDQYLGENQWLILKAASKNTSKPTQ